MNGQSKSTNKPTLVLMYSDTLKKSIVSVYVTTCVCNDPKKKSMCHCWVGKTNEPFGYKLASCKFHGESHNADDSKGNIKSPVSPSANRTSTEDNDKLIVTGGGRCNLEKLPKFGYWTAEGSCVDSCAYEKCLRDKLEQESKDNIKNLLKLRQKSNDVDFEQLTIAIQNNFNQPLSILSNMSDEHGQCLVQIASLEGRLKELEFIAQNDPLEEELKTVYNSRDESDEMSTLEELIKNKKLSQQHERAAKRRIRYLLCNAELTTVLHTCDLLVTKILDIEKKIESFCASSMLSIKNKLYVLNNDHKMLNRYIRNLSADKLRDASIAVSAKWKEYIVFYSKFLETSGSKSNIVLENKTRESDEKRGDLYKQLYRNSPINSTYRDYATYLERKREVFHSDKHTNFPK
jgi:hypothetical protein